MNSAMTGTALHVVPGGPGDRAGVKNGDIVTFLSEIGAEWGKPGDTLPIVIVHRGAARTAALTLGIGPRVDLRPYVAWIVVALAFTATGTLIGTRRPDSRTVRWGAMAFVGAAMNIDPESLPLRFIVPALAFDIV
ncbi:MAG TPA: hypothetical protein VEJ20_03620, partial [Candidatus Eremiobacteraceae bacterium]|nr:hypothetical protein [Candidatus Eremiobacteraceae bacterium]